MDDDEKNEKDIKKIVKEGYGKLAKKGEISCCAPVSCCDTGSDRAQDISKAIGYSEKEMKSVPEGANMGLGCGNPVAMASLKEGEIVLDLGSGPGLDCFLAAKKVGMSGKVIGIDMTPEMIEKARENAAKTGCTNVEFKQGEIENLPVDSNTIDIIISNCVINLSPDKKKVFKEACRVLKSGGRMMISDLVLLQDLPEIIKRSVDAYIGCLAGAMLKDRYLEAIADAGFEDIKIIDETNFPIELMANDLTAQAIIKDTQIPFEEIEKIAENVISIKILAKKS